MNKSVVLLSGGLDSLVSLALTLKNSSQILALTFNYGQKSFLFEKNSSEKIAAYYAIEHKTVALDWLAQISNSSLNTSDSVPHIEMENLDNISAATNTAKSVWVPNRNGLFVNIAACYAEALGYNEIVIGANKEEGATFKDNTVEFTDAINNSFKNSLNAEIKLSAPLINFSKTEIVKIGTDENVPFELLHSCYLGEGLHCGECESCMRLKRALIQNNRQDIVKKIFRG